MMNSVMLGVKRFSQLTDVPGYSGNAGLAMLVNSGEDALIAGSAKHTFTKIYDGGTPSEGYLIPLGVIPYTTAGVFQGGCVTVFGGYMYVGGGAIQGGNTNQFWRMSLATQTWERLANLPISQGCDCQAAVHDGKLYCMSNEKYGGGQAYKLMCYDIALDSWSQVTWSAGAHDHAYILPTAAFLGVVTVDDPGPVKLYEVDYVNLATQTWKVDQAGIVYGISVINDEIYLCDSTTNMKKYNPAGPSWTATGITSLTPTIGTHFFHIEDEDCIWQEANGTLYRSDGTNAFVNVATVGNARSNHMMLPSGKYGDFWGFHDQANPVQTLDDGCYGKVIVDGIYDLLSQSFDQGNFLIVEPHGAEIFCSVSDQFRMVITQYTAMILTASETWDFYATKNFDYADIDIWRAT